MDKSGRINLRVTPAEKESWEQAAGGARNVSSWLRTLANEAASDLPVVRKATSKKPETCPRWMHHRPGVFCGSCP